MSRISEVYCSTKDGHFVFPEIDQNYVDPNKMAIAVSGGGTRSMTAAMGHMRAFRSLNPKFYENVSYISGISGGSWFNTIFAYSNVDLDELLGESIPLCDISRTALEHRNFERNNLFMGHVLTHCPFLESFVEGHNKLPPHKIFDYVCANMFLKKYGLQNRIPTLNPMYAELNHELNGIECIIPSRGMPYIISTAAIIDKDSASGEIEACEFTPLYSGVRTHNDKYGGLMFSNQGFACNYKHINVDDHDVHRLTVDPHFGNCTLETAMAASGAAFATEVYKLHDSIIGGILGEFNPKTNIWGRNSCRDYEVSLTDGSYFDYTGIIPLLARGCRKIIAFQNCDKFAGNYCSFGINHLFGVEQDFKCYGCEYRSRLQVFHVRDWVTMREHFDEQFKNGEFLCHRATLEVLKNKHAGVNGGYDVDIIFIPLSPSRFFNESVKHVLHSSEMRDFPNINYLFSREDKLIELYKTQVNLLSTYTDMCLRSVIEKYPDFFEELRQNCEST